MVSTTTVTSFLGASLIVNGVTAFQTPIDGGKVQQDFGLRRYGQGRDVRVAPTKVRRRHNSITLLHMYRDRCE